MKLFYTSLQRCGTKSFGIFFRNNGYRVATWKTAYEFEWMDALLQGEMPGKISTGDISKYDIFEDGPWFDISLIKYLYNNIPDSRFVYFWRDPADWYQSMLRLADGNIPGNPLRHCTIYNRLDDYYRFVDAGNPPEKATDISMEGMFEHYQTEFVRHAQQIRAFFEDKPTDRFFITDLYDEDKWKKLNNAWGLELKSDSDVHVHKSRNSRANNSEFGQNADIRQHDGVAVRAMPWDGTRLPGSDDDKRKPAQAIAGTPISGESQDEVALRPIEKSAAALIEAGGHQHVHSMWNPVREYLEDVHRHKGLIEAVESYARALRLCPAIARAKLQWTKDHPDADRDEQIEALRTGTHEVRLEHLLEFCIAQGPVDVLVVKMAQLLFQRYRFDVSVTLLQAFTGVNAEYPPAFRLLAMGCVRWGLDKDAAEHLATIYRLAPRSSTTMFPGVEALLQRTIETPAAQEVLAIIRKSRRGGKFTANRYRRVQLVLGEFDEIENDLAPPLLGGTWLRRPVSVKEWSSAHGTDYTVVAPADTIPVSAEGQQNWDGIIKEVPSSEPYVARLTNVIVTEGSDLILDAGDAVISDSLAHPDFGTQVDLRQDKVAFQHENKYLLKIDGEVESVAQPVFNLTGVSSKRFGHWFSEYLPKLFCLSQFAGHEEIPILVDNYMPKQHYDFLAAVMPGHPTIELERGAMKRFENLYVAPTTTFRTFFLKPGHTVPVDMQGGLSPRVLRFLRQQVLANVEQDDAPSPERIYLSRGHSSWRQMENEAEFVSFLIGEGFEIVCFRDISFAEQVRIMRGARQIVGQNTSAFNNIIFADPDVKLLVCQSSSYDWRTGNGPLRALGYRPEFVEDEVPTAEKNDKVKAKHRPFQLPLELAKNRVRAQWNSDR